MPRRLAPLPPIDTIWAMMIVWRTRGDYRTARAVLEAIIAFSVMHTYYEQLLQVKQICLCLTGFTSLCLDAYVFCVLLYFTACMLYYCNTVGWAWWDWGLIWWLTILLQCFDTVGWATWPVKISSPNDLYCVEWDVKPYTLTTPVDKKPEDSFRGYVSQWLSERPHTTGHSIDVLYGI